MRTLVVLAALVAAVAAVTVVPAPASACHPELGPPYNPVTVPLAGGASLVVGYGPGFGGCPHAINAYVCATLLRDGSALAHACVPGSALL